VGVGGLWNWFKCVCVCVCVCSAEYLGFAITVTLYQTAVNGADVWIMAVWMSLSDYLQLFLPFEGISNTAGAQTHILRLAELNTCG
jgi:hypothetical protein